MSIKNLIPALLLLSSLIHPFRNCFAQMPVSEGHIQIALSKITAAVVVNDKKETLIESLEFTYNPAANWNPVFLIAVSALPSVELLPDDNFFNRLDKLTRNNFSKDNIWKQLLFPDVREEDFTPPDTFSRPVKVIGYDIISPDSGMTGLQRWFNENSYIIPKNGSDLILNYFKRGWYILIIKLDTEHTESKSRDKLLVNQGHSLPLKITFNSDKPVLPLQLASIQPDYDSLAAPFIDRWYGKDMEDLGADKNPRIDSMLSAPPLNAYPQIPLDLTNLHLELYAISTGKMAVSGYITRWADKINRSNLFESKHSINLDLPNRPLWLTRLTGFTPFIQLQDLNLIPSASNVRVNPDISVTEFLVRNFILVVLLILSLFFIFRIIFNHSSD